MKTKPIIIDLGESADMFCGAGGTSTGLIDAVGQRAAETNKAHHITLTAINHWQIAIETHKLNHPTVRHIQDDLERIQARDVIPGGDLRLLVASPECFPAGTLILTQTGLLPIEKVSVGMKVLTHHNRWRQVTEVMISQKDTVVMRGYGHYGLEVTREHPFWSIRRTRRWQNDIRRWRYKYENPDWRTAADMLGAYWATPTHIDVLPVPSVGGRGVDFSPEFWWMVGRWLGDGVVRIRERNCEVGIVCGKHEVSDLENRLNFSRPISSRAETGEFRWRKRELRTAVLFETAHKGLGLWLVEHFGKLAVGKTIPAWALTMPEKWRQQLLAGYMSADGHCGKKRCEASSVSKSLAIGLRLIAESLGHRTSLYYKAPNISARIEGRTISERPQYRVAWRRELAPGHEQTTETNGHSWLAVKEIKPGGRDVTVYNLSVAEDESYVADGIVVHNCVHFSNARGGEPMNWQSRATSKYVVRWASQINIEDILLENVREFMSWGPLYRNHPDPTKNGRPIPSRKGQFFRAFVRKLESLGYTVDHRLLCAADFGDPTSRVRFFLRARKSDSKISWPKPTHAAKTKNLSGKFKPHRTAREIIEWSDVGESIFAKTHGPNHNRYLVANTMRRIFVGLQKFGGLSFVLPNEGYFRGNQPRSADEALPTVTSRGAGHVVNPYLVMFYGQNHSRSSEQPFPCVTAQGNHVGLAQPYLLAIRGGDDAYTRGSPVSEPFQTITTMPGLALVNPHLIKFYGTADAASVDEPLDAVTTKERFGVAVPFIFNMEHTSDASGHDRRVFPAHQVFPTLTARAAFGVAQPFVIGQQSCAAPRSVDEPLPTIACAGAISLINPFAFVVNHGEAGYQSLDNPLKTITGADTWNFANPVIVPVNHGRDDARSHSVQNPFPSLTSVDAWSVAQPVASSPLADIECPLPTELPDEFGPFKPFLFRHQGRFVLLVLTQGGVAMLDVRFRMIKPPELARAHSLDNYTFVGSREQVVKQIGNSVPKRLAQALCYSALFN